MKYQAVIRLAICVILTAGLIGTVLCFALDSRDKALLNRQSDALTEIRGGNKKGGAMAGAKRADVSR